MSGFDKNNQTTSSQRQLSNQQVNQTYNPIQRRVGELNNQGLTTKAINDYVNQKINEGYVKGPNGELIKTETKDDGKQVIKTITKQIVSPNGEIRIETNTETTTKQTLNQIKYNKEIQNIINAQKTLKRIQEGKIKANANAETSLNKYIQHKAYTLGLTAEDYQEPKTITTTTYTTNEAPKGSYKVTDAKGNIIYRIQGTSNKGNVYVNDYLVQPKISEIPTGLYKGNTYIPTSKADLELYNIRNGIQDEPNNKVQESKQTTKNNNNNFNNNGNNLDNNNTSRNYKYNPLEFSLQGRAMQNLKEGKESEVLQGLKEVGREIAVDPLLTTARFSYGPNYFSESNSTNRRKPIIDIGQDKLLFVGKDKILTQPETINTGVLLGGTAIALTSELGALGVGGYTAISGLKQLIEAPTIKEKTKGAVYGTMGVTGIIGERVSNIFERKRMYNSKLNELSDKFGENSKEVKEFKKVWEIAYEKLKRYTEPQKEWTSKDVEVIKGDKRAIKIVDDAVRKYGKDMKIIGTTVITPQTELISPPRKISGDIDISKGNVEFITEVYNKMKKRGYDVRLSKENWRGTNKYHLNLNGKEFINMAEDSTSMTYGQIRRHQDLIDITPMAWVSDKNNVNMLNLRDQVRAKTWAGYIEESRPKDIIDVKGISESINKEKFKRTRFEDKKEKLNNYNNPDKLAEVQEYKDGRWINKGTKEVKDYYRYKEDYRQPIIYENYRTTNYESNNKLKKEYNIPEKRKDNNIINKYKDYTTKSITQEMPIYTDYTPTNYTTELNSTKELIPPPTYDYPNNETTSQQPSTNQTDNKLFKGYVGVAYNDYGEKVETPVYENYSMALNEGKRLASEKGLSKVNIITRDAAQSEIRSDYAPYQYNNFIKQGDTYINPSKTYVSKDLMDSYKQELLNQEKEIYKARPKDATPNKTIMNKNTRFNRKRMNYKGTNRKVYKENNQSNNSKFNLSPYIYGPRGLNNAY